MDYQLKILGQVFYLDEDQDNDLVLSRAVNNISDVQGRDADQAKDFDGAMIASNKLLLESAQVLNSGTVIPYRKLPAYIEKSGNIVSIGYCLLLEAGDVFRMSYYGGNADWFAEVGDKTLRDLDLHLLDHFYTAANVRAARLSNTTPDAGYCYPNVDYGPWQVGPTVYWTDFFTGVYAKYALMQCFLDAGFTVTGDFIDNNTDLAKMFIPFCSTFQRNTHYQYRWYVKATNSVAFGCTNNPGLAGAVGWGTVLYNSYNPFINPTLTRRIMVLLDPITVHMKFSGETTSAEVVPITVDVYGLRQDRNAGTSPGNVLLGTITVNPGTNPFSMEFDYTGEYMYEIAFDTAPGVACTIDAGAILESMSYEEYEVDNINEYLQILPDLDCYFDDTYNYVAVSGTLPDMKQKDLILHIFNSFCLMCDTDHQINYVNVFGFNDVLGNIPNAVDWSNKLDLSARPRISYVFNDYAQSNEFRFKDDQENRYLLESPEFGNDTIEIDNENLPLKKVVFQSEFATVIRQSQSFSGTVRMAYIPKFIDGDEVDCEPYIGVIEFETIHLVTMDGYALETTQPAMHEMTFPYLLPKYYGALSGILNYSKIIDCLMKLNSIDVGQLDFSKPVYIDYFNAYFYVNVVDRYKLTASESTQVQLVRL